MRIYVIHIYIMYIYIYILDNIYIYIYWFGGLDELTVCAIDCIRVNDERFETACVLTWARQEDSFVVVKKKKKEEKNTQSINGDCLELMASLGDRPSIFLIIKL